MRETNDRSVSYLNTINQQLNDFASGNIPQSIIPPGELRNSLLTISCQLPPTMTLPADSVNNIWYYYKRCALITKFRKFIILISMKINDVTSKFTIFKIIIVPVGLANITSVAYHRLDEHCFAMSLYNTRYMLNPANALLCIHSPNKICSPNSAIYSVMNTKNCAISLFMKKSINENCDKIVRTDSTLSSAIYIKPGVWAITLNKPLSITIVCNSKDRKSHIIHPYVQVLMLQPNCHAYSGELILPAHFQGHSESRIIDKYAPLITVFNQSFTPEIWRSIVQNNDNFKIHIPKHLENVQKIHMRHII